MTNPPGTPDVARVRRYLPSDAVENGWDDARIIERWTGYLATTVRAYWYDRVQETAGYIDLPDAAGTLAITQQYRQAKEMLAYWDGLIEKWGPGVDPDFIASRATRVGKIKKRYERPGTFRIPLGRNNNSPYKPV